MTESNILHGDEIENVIPVNLGELIQLMLQSYDEKVLQVDADTGKEFTAKHILKKATRLARWLQSKGLGPGDTISVICENRLEFCLITSASFLAGITLAPLNPGYTADELQHTLNLSKPQIIFCSAQTLQRIVDATNSNSFIKYIVSFDKNTYQQQNGVFSFEQILQEKFLDDLESEEFNPPKIDTNETIATIMCSSGTTGMPKGVMTTQKNILTFLSLLKQITKQQIEETSDDVLVGLVPFFHSMGFMVKLITLLGGRKLMVIKKFQIKTFLETLERYKVSVLSIPPPIVVLLCQSPLTNQYDLSNITEIRCGAAPLAKEFERKIAKKLKLKAVTQAYGMTETTLGVVFNQPEYRRPGSVGKLVPAMSGKVIDENGKPLGPYCEGELCFKGPLIMKGYVNDPEATANTIDKDGWLHTGDIGYYDKEHFFFIVDRIKELIKYKGYQVPPAELESILMSHPDIIDAAVVGLPDDRAGELPLGYVVLKPNVKITAQKIQHYVKGKVSPQKQLRGGVRIIESIPRNPSGKILRRVLKQAAIQAKSKL